MIHLGYKDMKDWYNVAVKDIFKNGGRGLLKWYKDSPSAALGSVYPDHIWELERFKNKPRGIDTVVLSYGTFQPT